RELAAEIPVFLNLISKAEQGYALAGLHQPSPLPDSDPLVNRVTHGLARAWLTGAMDRELGSDLAELAGRPGLPDHLAKDVAWLQGQLQAGQSVAVLASQSVRLGQFQLALLALEDQAR
ncbi:MAG: CYTH domain-containing protein, partial [Pseudomonadota bacterium]